MQEEERDERRAGAGPEGPLRAGARRRRVPRGALARGGLRQLLVRAGRPAARAALGRARPPAPQAAAQQQRGGGPEAEAHVPRGGQAVPARGLGLQQLQRARRQLHGRAGGAGRARRAGGQRAGRAGRRAAAGRGAARGRRPLPLPGARRARARRHRAARQGHVRRAVALPRHLRRGLRAVRHHPRLREAPHQARARRLGHRQPRPVSVRLAPTRSPRPGPALTPSRLVLQEEVVSAAAAREAPRRSPVRPRVYQKVVPLLSCNVPERRRAARSACHELEIYCFINYYFNYVFK